MTGAISGPLLTSDYLRLGVPAAATPADLGRAHIAAYARGRREAARMLGPAAAPWHVHAIAARPLIRWLGWPDPAPPSPHATQLHGSLIAAGADEVALTIVAGGEVARRSTAIVSEALRRGTRWALVTDGSTVRLIDTLQPASRAHLDFDLDACAGDDAALAWLAVLLAPSAFAAAAAGGLRTHIRRSADLGVQVCRHLRDGVGRALETFTAALASAPGRRRAPALCRPEALTAVYRVLFLLFAEARQLVPVWHPVYRRAYSLEALRSRLAAAQSPRGTWAALQAIARLAHAGAEAGDLRVTAFNGRLFAPARAPLLDHLALDDRLVALALDALCFTAMPGAGRHRIAYGELGVEELGSVYESLLDRPPATGDRPPSRKPIGVARKTTGTFYTPRSIADVLVADTLAPLVAGRTAEQVLQLRVLDPAMGSGAFLVAAGRYLLASWQRALVDRGDAREADIADADRVAASRRIASHCLFGVDRNPMAVQLAQLSLWLATLASDRPLSFLDHHLVPGNSLVGASPLDVMSRAPGSAAPDRLPLDALFDWSDALAGVRVARREIESVLDDDVDAVRRKERSLSALARLPELVRWKRACDLWCAATMRGGQPRALYHAMLDRCLGRREAAGIEAAGSRLDRLLLEAREAGCFHWPLEFPEVFLDRSGRPLPDGGFDAVIGNPPWEMLRGDAGRDASARAEGATLVRFTRRSGLYRTQGRGHANQVQLFVERALQLTRPSGRVGLIAPASLLTDEGSEPLRRGLIRSHRLDAVTVYDNRNALFPIHRSFRFATLTVACREATRTIRYRSGVVDPGQAGQVPALHLTAGLIERLSGQALAIPDLPSPADLRIVEQLTCRHPPLSARAGWNVTFARELNATDDRDCIAEGGAGLPVIEGKHLRPFRVDLGAAVRRADAAAVRDRLSERCNVDRARLAYRDVASATNRTTLIAAVLPPGVVSVHTVFCLRTGLPREQQHVLCALLNSYVANYLARRWVTTHVTTRIASRLPVPPIARGTALFETLLEAATTLAAGPDVGAAVRVQVAAAVAYGIAPEDLEHVLGTFPLVPLAEREAILGAFSGAPTRTRR